MNSKSLGSKYGSRNPMRLHLEHTLILKYSIVKKTHLRKDLDIVNAWEPRKLKDISSIAS
jgi:hypothetical protein